MITSTNNDRIKNIVKLSTSSRARREQNAFIAEGVKMFIEAPLLRIKEVYINDALLDKVNIAARYGDDNDEAQLLKKCSERLKQTGYTVVTDQVFKKMSDTITPQGLLTVVTKERPSLGKLLADKVGKQLRVLILENIQDPGNLGTMIRTAEAAGCDAIIANEGTVDMYNPKVIRATMGSIYRVPVMYKPDLKKEIERLKSVGVLVLASHLKGKRSFTEVNGGQKLAVMIGNEGSGLSDELTAMADELIRIPMHGQVESLNAAVAAALLMYRFS